MEAHFETTKPHGHHRRTRPQESRTPGRGRRRPGWWSSRSGTGRKTSCAGCSGPAMRASMADNRRVVGSTVDRPACQEQCRPAFFRTAALADEVQRASHAVARFRWPARLQVPAQQGQLHRESRRRRLAATGSPRRDRSLRGGIVQVARTDDDDHASAELVVTIWRPGATGEQGNARRGPCQSGKVVRRAGGAPGGEAAPSAGRAVPGAGHDAAAGRGPPPAPMARPRSSSRVGSASSRSDTGCRPSPASWLGDFGACWCRDSRGGTGGGNV